MIFSVLVMAIDIMKLYTHGSNVGWNEFLTECHNTKNINKLAKVKRELQEGMAALAKTKLNTDDINTQFARWVSSIEKTARKIIREKYPVDKTDTKTSKANLKARHFELANFFRKTSY